MNINIMISTTLNMPIYEQIVKQIRDAVINGQLSPGEGLPSIRMLAKDLAVSVITTKRAYEELEKEGVITSVPGRGFYVCKQNNDHLREKQRMNLEARFLDLIAECKQCGLSLDEILELVQVLYEEENYG
ncbi:MAG: GntR family transcriptional regulator [Wujia sp.]